MNPDHPGVEEKIGRALAGGNLTYQSGSINAVIALGCVGIDEPVADAVFRLKYANDPHSYADAVKAVSEMASKASAKHDWKLKDADRLATEVVNYWLADVCPSCTGKRADPEKMGPTSMQIVGTPSLQKFACDACRGSGKRPYPWQREGRSAWYYTAILAALEVAERRIRGKLIDRLAHEIRDSAAGQRLTFA